MAIWRGQRDLRIRQLTDCACLADEGEIGTNGGLAQGQILCRRCSEIAACSDIGDFKPAGQGAKRGIPIRYNLPDYLIRTGRAGIGHGQITPTGFQKICLCCGNINGAVTIGGTNALSRQAGQAPPVKREHFATFAIRA